MILVIWHFVILTDHDPWPHFGTQSFVCLIRSFGILAFWQAMVSDLRKRTAVDGRLRLLDYAIGAEADAYEDVLIALSAGIRKSAQRIDRAPKDDDAFIADETQVIENVLGTAYVVCQNEITAVVQAVLRVDDTAKASIFQATRAGAKAASALLARNHVENYQVKRSPRLRYFGSLATTSNIMTNGATAEWHLASVWVSRGKLITKISTLCR